jgi:uncharacterized protein YjbI with pentapeptide repeats
VTRARIRVAAVTLASTWLAANPTALQAVVCRDWTPLRGAAAKPPPEIEPRIKSNDREPKKCLALQLQRPTPEQWRAGPLCEANLAGLVLPKANLYDRALTLSDLTGTNLTEADLQMTRLNGAVLRGTILNDADLSAADFVTTRVSNIQARGADLSHALFLQSEISGADFTGADFTNAIFFNMRACHSDFRKAIFRNDFEHRIRFVSADFSDSNFSGVLFKDLDMSGFMARSADFTEARFSGTNLSRAKLSESDFRRSRLNGVNLTGADLGGADLRNATIEGAILADARLAQADLEGALYHPVGAPPGQLLGLKGIIGIRFNEGGEEGLFKLRDALRKAGLRDLERQATYALERNRALHDMASGQPSRVAEGAIRTLLFDWTTMYGVRPGRSIMLLFVSALLLTPVYAWALSRGGRASGAIYRVRPRDRIEESESGVAYDLPAEAERVSASGARAIKWGAYFSLVSAFHIGFREFNVGSWISRLTPRKFTLEPVGWVRTLAGFQSLVSVYLVALAVLTYFGRPFD